ncbi:hypothetical protein CPB83DRAFT_350684 [Crepidotus variabilis]|uniref:F-box domain-containing protein n=1 Tax=Crepidotus variabilis TaxID=179855 RepID=A0A9P6EFQ8_9AGAR|nr:hypothetical protein CPB83DRAFT_350684 [Crepidotus variabilis]
MGLSQHRNIGDMCQQVMLRRELLEKEESQLITAVLNIRSKLNELVPVFQLPPEVLEEVFTLCISWLYGYQKPKHRLSWTQVCGAWRHLAFSSARLWQHIDLGDSRLADEFLFRSKGAPLFITSSSPLKLTPNTLTLHSRRLESIDVFLFPNDMAHLFSSIGRYLPMLRNLSLKITPMSSTIYLDLSLPSLRRLSLEGVAIRWEECSNLTHFSLRGYNTAACPSISQLHDILEASPQLEYVRLECFVPPSVKVVERPPIVLLHLKEFTISSKPAVSRSILSSVLLSPKTRLQLYLSLSEDLHSLFPEGLPYASDSSVPYKATSLLSHHRGKSIDVSSIRLSRHGAYFIRPSSSTWCDDPSAFLLSLSSASPLSSYVCTSLSHILDLTTISHLELNTGVLLDITVKSLENLFRDLDCLRSLAIAFNDIDQLFEVLQFRDNATGSMYLPRLETLSFSKPYDLWWHFGGRWMESIFATIKIRRTHGCPLRTLEFFSCHGLSQSVVQDLGRSVDQVTVKDQSNVKKNE